MDIKDIKDAKVTHSGLLQHNSDGTTELQKITHAGLIARSPQGTAAKGMNIRGNEDLWVEIQANTFRNWVNEHLKDAQMQVSDWTVDFCDGTHLCALVENLQKQPLKPSWNRRPGNQHHYLENATVALKSIEGDGIKLVNIGNVDIVNGNVKLILGLIWSLIVRYQIGRSKFPPRKLMLAWLQAALPECKINNLTTDWNSGVNLAALLDYCQPGLFPHWRNIDPNQAIRNCTTAMNMAQSEFGIPKVLEPEYLASPWLDELSGMTYLSYFMKVGGPGYKATMRWVNSQVKAPITNFTTDWNDGKIFCEILKGLGAPAPDAEKISINQSSWESNIKKAIDAGERLGVKPILTPKDMSNPDVEHLGIMAYAAHLQWIPPRAPLSDMLAVHLESTSGRVGEPAYFRVEIYSKEIDMSSVRAYIVPPMGGIEHLVKLNADGQGAYVPDKYGMHEIVLEVEDDKLPGHYFRVLPRFIHVVPPGMAPCALGSLVEVLVNATGTPKTEDILVTAYSPTGRSLKCPLKHGEEGHSAIFKPDEAGIWEIAITYQGRHIQGGPFTCSVFDPNGVTIHGIDGGMPLRAHTFEVDARGVGVSGELHIDIVHEKHSLVCSVEKLEENKYRVTFMPRQNGKYRIYIYFNGYDVKGSPYIMRVGTKGRSGKTRSSPHHDQKHRAESPSMHYSTSTITKHNDFLTAKKELYAQDEQNVRSYSPQYSLSYEDKSKDLYALKRDSEPRYSSSQIKSNDNRPTATNKFGNESYTKSEVRKQSNNNDYYYNKESELFSKKKDTDTSLKFPRNVTIEKSRQRNESLSPIESPVHIRASPVTITTSSRYETTTRNINSGTRNFSSSPSPKRDSQSPLSNVNYITSSTHRIASPVTVQQHRTFSPISLTRNVSSPITTKGGESYKITEKSSTYKSDYVSSADNHRDSPTYLYSRRISTSPEPVDHSSNIRVSTMKTGTGAGRRDSWDVLNKTKYLFSHNSLESLANMTENQLNTDLSYNRPQELDHETERNTRYNKFSLAERERRASDDMEKNKLSNKSSVSLKQESNYNSSRNYSTITKEKTHHQLSSMTTRDDDYEHASSFRPIYKDLTGSRSIIVQDIPDGVLGIPVEFEIDGSRAGSGNLEILVNGGRVTSAVRALGSQKFIASFTSHEPGNHTVQITFNGETVPGSPWYVNIMSSPGLKPLGESTRLVPAHTPAVFEILPPPGSSLNKGECLATVLAPSKSKVNARITHEAANGAMRIEFVPKEVGTHIIEASIDETKLVGGPLIAKVYDASLIQVTDVNGGVVGQPCQFRVDASAAGEGQLEISINEGEVPNHVQVVGGGRCLVSFTPEQAKSHFIDIKFNGETVNGCPFICSVADTSRVLLNLLNLELIPLNKPASFHITVSGGGAAELAVSVRGPQGELPVRVTGDIHSGFTAEFTPTTVGGHSINVEYNGYPVQGTPFLAKSYDATKVDVGSVTKGQVGRPVQFTVDAGDAGEGNLEITISAKGHNIPTQVHPQGNAKFAVSFVPTEPCEHIINVSFNKMPVPGCPISVLISGGMTGPQVSLGGPGPVHLPNTLVINHAGGRLEDIEVNVEGPSGQSVPAQVLQTADGIFKADFVPRSVGEHRVSVTVVGQPTAGSPYSAKVYDVSAIKVKNVNTGTVGKVVTFLVETSQAGPGNLEVTVNGGRVPTSAQAQGQHTYAISFTPRDAQNHTVELRFNGQDVPGSPFTCKVSAAARIISPESLDKVSVGRLFEFNVESDEMPVVEVLGPARRNVPSHIEPIDNGFTIKFEPIDVGDHSVEVRLQQGEHLEGSPFLLKAYSAERVIVTDIRSSVVGKSVSFGINASQAGAGNLEIIVAVNGKNVPNFVQSEGNARFKVNFKPTEAASHSLSVRFNGLAVPGSPFSCHIAPAPISLPKASATGEALKQAAIRSDNVFELEGFDQIEPLVFVTSPSGENVPTRLVMRDDNYIATFCPTVVGRHLISVTANDQHINGSPFSCNVFDVSRVSISGLEQHNGPTPLSVPVTFSVDAAGAGEGTLELVVSTATSTVKAEVVACARGLYDVTFIPQTCEPHFVNITFNDVSVDGNPFKIEVQQNTQFSQVGSVSSIDNISENQILEIIGPDNKQVAYTINRNLAEFRTNEVGSYTIRFIDRETRNLIGTRAINVFDPTMIKIIEVSEAYCNRPAHIALSIYEAGQGTLSSIVRCGSLEVPHSIRGPTKTGTWEIVYHPTRVATHKITIMYNGVPVSNNPIEVNVQASTLIKEINVTGLGLYQSRLGKTTSFSIDTNGRPAREFDIVVSGPGGEALPVRCYQTKAGHLQAEYTINKIGKCMIEVLHQSKQVQGSPYVCESYDSSKVTVQGVPTGQLMVHDVISFILNTQDAGKAEIEVLAASPNGQNLPVQIIEKSEGLHMIEFLTNIPGRYKVIVQYGGEVISGSPITFVVSAPNTKQDIRATGNGLEIAQRGKETKFHIYCPTTPNIQIERIGSGSENSERIDTKVKSLDNNEWKVLYTIPSVGKYEIRANCPNRGSLPGSPWHILCVDVNKVLPIGGWNSMLDNDGQLLLPARLVFDTAQAGPGTLLCCVDGQELVVDKQADGKSRFYISADGLSTGEHNFDLTWSGLAVPNSPRSALVVSQTAAEKVILTGRGLAAAQADEVAHFTIDATDAQLGHPEVILVYQDNTSVPVSLTQPKANEQKWLASYTPFKSAGGPINLSVKWNGRLVKGCPLTVAVGSSVDATKVLCSGEGLRHGVVGREIRSWIDTRRAGPGELTAHCNGPRKVAYCELYDHGDATFTLNVKPQEPGRHSLTIKYGGQHVSGSPFALKVAGAPDASKVRVYGPGIEHGVLATFQSRFICDTRGAGAGQLTVRVRGPKGAFRVEMQRESQKDRTILCKYDPTEPGDYRVEVKWAGELVPGSPFPVMIFDTEEELRRFIQGA